MENREIKFRGIADVAIDAGNFQVEEGQMIFGQVVFGTNQTFIVGPVIDCNNEYISLGTWCSVRPETVGQYIGIKDADGVESYQDDRVECLIDGEAYGEPDIIGFEKGVFWLRRRNRSMASWLEIEEYQGKEVVADFRVIGNIHESPPPAAQ